MRARPTVPGDLAAKYLATFEKYTDKSAGLLECWTWRGETNRNGYGRINIYWPGNNRVRKQAHRFYYEALNGPLPDDIQLDHLCRNRLCVNPAHLEPVTNAENSRRGEHPALAVHYSSTCTRGHDKATHGRWYVDGSWKCLACDRLRYAMKTATHCRRGHALDDDNVTISKNGKRCCRTCYAQRFATRDVLVPASATRSVVALEQAGGKELVPVK